MRIFRSEKFPIVILVSNLNGETSFSTSVKLEKTKKCINPLYLSTKPIKRTNQICAAHYLSLLLNKQANFG